MAKIDRNGVIVEMTEEEIAAMQGAAQEHELTDIEKLKIRTTANEDALAGMMDMMMGGML